MEREKLARVDKQQALQSKFHRICSVYFMEYWLVSHSVFCICKKSEEDLIKEHTLHFPGEVTGTAVFTRVIFFNQEVTERQKSKQCSLLSRFRGRSGFCSRYYLLSGAHAFDPSIPWNELCADIGAS